MRHLVLALMIVLLPLRGWAGDAMATQMASHAIAIESASFDHQNQALDTPQAIHDCHEQAAGGLEADHTANNDHCGTCQACQACHTVALSPSALKITTSFTSPHLRPVKVAAFTSAAAALGQKPPIS